MLNQPTRPAPNHREGSYLRPHYSHRSTCARDQSSLWGCLKLGFTIALILVIGLIVEAL